LIAALDDAPLGRFHLHAALVSGMGFFTDAYDLFVIGVASTLITQGWQLSADRLALLNSTMLGAAFVGAFVFGRVADLIGRKHVYWLVAVIMVVAALGSALAPSYWVLIGFRFLLGLGVGGDYPVSAVLMSEYANRNDRGRMVGLVFSTQALGLIIGPLIASVCSGPAPAQMWPGGCCSDLEPSRRPLSCTCGAGCQSRHVTWPRCKAAPMLRLGRCRSSAQARCRTARRTPWRGTRWDCERS